MKRLFIVIFVCLFFSQFQFANMQKKVVAKKKFCLNLLKKYNKRGYFLLNFYLRYPMKSIHDYIQSNSLSRVLYMLPVAVHEATHLYTWTHGFNPPKNRGNFFRPRRKWKLAPFVMNTSQYNYVLSKIKNRRDYIFFKKAYIPGRKGKVILRRGNKKIYKRINRIFDETGYKHKRMNMMMRYNLNTLRVYSKPKMLRFFPGDGKYYLIKTTKVYRTQQMAKSVPMKLRNYRFSPYKTYISTNDAILTSQTRGIYGLTDEFIAFYSGAKVAFDLLPYYKNHIPESVEKWRWYFKTLNWHIKYYNDFKYYILQYLLYAKKHYRDIYNGILRNNAFKKAFRIIYSKWNKLLKDYFKMKKRMFSDLRRKGYVLIENDKYLIIRKGRVTRVVLSSVNVFKMYTPLFRKRKFINALNSLIN